MKTNLLFRNSASVPGSFMKIQISVIAQTGFADLSEIKSNFQKDQNGYFTVTLPLLHESS